MKSFFLALFLLSIPTLALAAEESVSVNAGISEMLGVAKRNHMGLYPNVGVSLTEKSDPYSLTLELGVELAPENLYWGFFGSASFDYALSKYVGIDFALSSFHDQPKEHWHEANYYGGFGTGVSFFMDQLTVSPSVTVFFDLYSGLAIFAPGVNLSYCL